MEYDLPIKGMEEKAIKKLKIFKDIQEFVSKEGYVELIPIGGKKFHYDFLESCLEQIQKPGREEYLNRFNAFINGKKIGELLEKEGLDLSGATMTLNALDDDENPVIIKLATGRIEKPGRKSVVTLEHAKIILFLIGGFVLKKDHTKDSIQVPNQAFVYNLFKKLLLERNLDLNDHTKKEQTKFFASVIDTYSYGRGILNDIYNVEKPTLERGLDLLITERNLMKEVHNL